MFVNFKLPKRDHTTSKTLHPSFACSISATPFLPLSHVTGSVLGITCLIFESSLNFFSTASPGEQILEVLVLVQPQVDELWYYLAIATTRKLLPNFPRSFFLSLFLSGGWDFLAGASVSSLYFSGACFCFLWRKLIDDWPGKLKFARSRESFHLRHDADDWKGVVVLRVAWSLFARFEADSLISFTLHFSLVLLKQNSKISLDLFICIFSCKFEIEKKLCYSIGLIFVW